MKTSIIGASGYTGQELVSLLIQHPMISLEFVTSRAHCGKAISSVIPRTGNSGNSIYFSNPSLEELINCDSEIFFLALPHGTAAEYAVPLVEKGKKVIDLSADFRLNTPSIYQEFYGQTHPAPNWLKDAQYGLPELYDLTWEKSPLIASPGCYPTSILIPLAPLLKKQLISPAEIIINSISGISGAGKNASEHLLYCERNESAGAYGLPKHRHLSEIEEQLSLFNGEPLTLSFQPHLGPMSRGLCSTISVRTNGDLQEDKIRDCWAEFYRHRPFVKILPQGQFPETGGVIHTNRIDLSVHQDSRTHRYVLCTAEDNLLKGAGGQAVQSMNLCNGYSETCGLP